MSTDPFEITQPSAPPEVTANVALIERAKHSSPDDKFMLTTVENVDAKSGNNGKLEDEEFTYQVLHATDEKQIQELRAQKYEMAFGHPYVSKENGLIVLKQNKEIRDLKYKTEVYHAERKLRRAKDEGEDISAAKNQGASAKFSESQSVKEVLDRLPKTEREADLEAIRRFNPNAVELDDDQ